MLWVHILSLGTAIILQISGTIDFTKSLYWFHIIAPLGFIVFAFSVIHEYSRYHNPAASQFAPAIIILAISTTLEVLNYWFNIIYIFTLSFQIGVLGFILALGIISIRYVQKSMETATEKIPSAKRLVFCENYAVNAIAKNKGIYISIELALGESNESAQDSDLCIILGNLLENAVAQQDLNTKRMYFFLQCTYTWINTIKIQRYEKFQIPLYTIIL